MKVQNYKLITSSGKHIRMATKVILPNGKEIKFPERMSQKEAKRQAIKALLGKRGMWV
jgi:hypothetical protein